MFCGSISRSFSRSLRQSVRFCRQRFCIISEARLPSRSCNVFSFFNKRFIAKLCPKDSFTVEDFKEGKTRKKSRMSSRNRDQIWHEEAGLASDSKDHVSNDTPSRNAIQSMQQVIERVKRTATTALHQIRCKWCVAVVTLVGGMIILASTIPILPFGHLKSGPVEEGPIGPNLDPKMRPCRSILSFSETPLPRIALASFAGSGNTFLRGALEQITGIWTGSAVPDYQLYHGGFYGEVTNNDKVLMIKTHGFGKKAAKANYKKAVLLIRKVDDAILAKWNQYKTRTHVGIAKADSYESRDWEYFAPRAINEWKELNEYWLAQNPATLHVVHFEELMKNKKEELKKILDFIGYTDVDNDVFQCVVDKFEGVFKRRKYKLDFEPFTTELKEQIENARDLIQQAVEEWKFSKFDTIELDENAS